MTAAARSRDELELATSRRGIPSIRRPGGGARRPRMTETWTGNEALATMTERHDATAPGGGRPPGERAPAPRRGAGRAAGPEPVDDEAGGGRAAGRRAERRAGRPRRDDRLAARPGLCCSRRPRRPAGPSGSSSSAGSRRSSTASRRDREEGSLVARAGGGTAPGGGAAQAMNVERRAWEARRRALGAGGRATPGPARRATPVRDDAVEQENRQLRAERRGWPTLLPRPTRSGPRPLRLHARARRGPRCSASPTTRPSG